MNAVLEVFIIIYEFKDYEICSRKDVILIIILISVWILKNIFYLIIQIVQLKMSKLYLITILYLMVF